MDLNTLSGNDQLLIKKNDVHYPLIIIQNGQAEIRNSDNKVFIFGKNDIILTGDIIEINIEYLSSNDKIKCDYIDHKFKQLLCNIDNINIELNKI